MEVSTGGANTFLLIFRRLCFAPGIKKKPPAVHKWRLIGGFGFQWSTHTLIWSLPSNVQRYSKVNIIYCWIDWEHSPLKECFIFISSYLQIHYQHNLQSPALCSLEFLHYLISPWKSIRWNEYILFNNLCFLLTVVKSCWGELVNSWDTFSSYFVRCVSRSTSADFSIPCCTGLLFLWRCISVGVERSEFMHMHFVSHSCLNLEPLGDQLQPCLKRGEGGWVVSDGSVLQSRNNQLQLWMEVLFILSWNCVVYILIFQIQHYLGKLKLRFLQNYSKQETYNEIK